jgi:hypothetical protein
MGCYATQWECVYIAFYCPLSKALKIVNSACQTMKVSGAVTYNIFLKSLVRIKVLCLACSKYLKSDHY